MIRMVMADGNGERLCGSCQKKKKSEVGGASDAGRKVRRDPRSGVMCLHSGQWHSCFLLWHPVPFRHSVLSAILWNIDVLDNRSVY